MNDQTPGPARGTTHDRLNGWKDIAAHFGKSVRTVQRWERELGMPVHRLHTAGGEIIFARRSELEQWENNIDRSENFGLAGEGARDTEAGQEVNEVEKKPGELMPENAHARIPGPGVNPQEAAESQSRAAVSRWHRWPAIAAVILVAALFWAAWEHDKILDKVPALRKVVSTHADRQPAYPRFDGDTLRVFNAGGDKLWEYRFPSVLTVDNYNVPRAPSEVLFMAFEDLDHDGGKELLMVTWGDPRSTRRLICFNTDGTVRFDIQPGQAKTYGGKIEAPPFLVAGFVLTAEPDGAKTIWVVALHNYEFPSLLQKLDTHGNVLSEYWGNGHIDVVQESRYNGRRVMLVGAKDNERVATSLAVLDYANPGGFAPSENPKYRCDDCPRGTPLVFIVFPQTEISREFATRPTLSEIRVEPNGRVTTTVVHSHHRLKSEPGQLGADVWYTLDEHFQLIDAETGDMYRRIHSAPEVVSRLKHAYRPKCEEQIFPVRVWDGMKFVELPRPSKARPISALPTTLAQR